jgi:hypothetical protein
VASPGLFVQSLALGNSLHSFVIHGFTIESIVGAQVVNLIRGDQLLKDAFYDPRKPGWHCRIAGNKNARKRSIFSQANILSI